MRTNLRASLGLRASFLLQASFMFLNNLVYFDPETLFGGSVRMRLFSLIPATYSGILPTRLAAQPSLGQELGNPIGAR